MERLNNKKNERQRSQPEGQIAPEKIDMNVVAGKGLRRARRKCEEGTPLRFARETLEYCENKLLSIVLRRNNIARRRMSQASLGYNDRGDYEDKLRLHSSNLFGDQLYYEHELKDLLGDYCGWDNARIEWLLGEMDEDIASDFRLALSAVVEDETARRLIPTLHIVADGEELQRFVDNYCLNDKAKDRVDYAFDSLGHLDRLENPRSLRDFERLVEIMEISATEAVSRMPQMA